MFQSPNPGVPWGVPRDERLASVRDRLNDVVRAARRAAEYRATGRERRKCGYTYLTEQDWDDAEQLPLQGVCGVVKIHKGKGLVLKRAAHKDLEESLENERNMHIWLWEHFPTTHLRYISEPVDIRGMKMLTTGQKYVKNAKQLYELTRFFKNVPRDELSAWKRMIADQVAQTWYEIHRLGVAHLDMHGGNVLYDDDNGHIVIIDFGFMRRFDDIPAFQQMFNDNLHDNLRFVQTAGRQGTPHMQQLYGRSGYFPETLNVYNKLGANEANKANKAQRRHGVVKRIAMFLAGTSSAALLWTLPKVSCIAR